VDFIHFSELAKIVKKLVKLKGVEEVEGVEEEFQQDNKTKRQKDN
jgi:hypothetical protein